MSIIPCDHVGLLFLILQKVFLILRFCLLDPSIHFFVY